MDMQHSSDEPAPNPASFGVGVDEIEPSRPWALALLGAIAMVAVWGLIDRLPGRTPARRQKRVLAGGWLERKTPLPEGSGA